VVSLFHHLIFIHHLVFINYLPFVIFLRESNPAGRISLNFVKFCFSDFLSLDYYYFGNFVNFLVMRFYNLGRHLYCDYRVLMSPVVLIAVVISFFFKIKCYICMFSE